MADDQNSGEKTEKATPKKLRDARKRGEIAKSKDVTSTLGFAFALALLSLGTGWALDRLVALFGETLLIADVPFEAAVRQQGRNAAELFLLLSTAVLLPMAAVGMLIEFLQAGPVLAFEKISPKLSHLDPVAGIKRMFAMDNLVEVLKSIAKTITLAVVLWIVVKGALGALVHLPAAGPAHMVEMLGGALKRLVGWTLGIFLLVTAFDAVWQRHSFAKKQRMSIKDIRQEHKDSEGDPLLKGQRKQMHQEWAQEGATQAAGDATVVVVNPTHVAIAIRYDAEDEPVPLVTGKGEHEIAQAMRDAANAAHVPVLRNELLARTLLRDAEVGDYVPRGLFDVVAEVILWAQRVTVSMRAPVERELEAALAGRDGLGWADDDADAPSAPGEDLTDYPVDGFGRTVGGPSAAEDDAGDAAAPDDPDRHRP